MCILMVEDEALILEIMAETLEDAGYDVMRAVDGLQAMALLDDHPSKFSALFSDYHLPGGLTGLDIARAARMRYPALPVVLATGRPDVLDPTWQSTDGFVLLRKPYGPSQMVSVIGNVLPPHHPPA